MAISSIIDELDKIIYITSDDISNSAAIVYLDVRGRAENLVYISRQDVAKAFIDGESPLSLLT